MKLSIPIIGFTLTVALVASGGIPGTNSTAVLATATAETPALAGVAPIQSEGEQLLQARCAVCHDLGGVAEFQAAYDENSLRELVATMISYGAQVNDAETDILVAYLLGNEQADAAPDFDEAAAANLVNASCTTCHDLTGIERGLYPADEWRETVSRMLGYGLNISDEEFETIVTYLGTSPDTAEADAAEADAAPAFDETAAASLVNASCTTCHDLTGIERGLYPADEWRETVSRMMGYGLNISNEEFETIVTYLGTAPDAVEAVDGDVDDDGYDAAAAEMLLNSACTTCHDLTGITSAPGTFTEADFRETIERMLGHGAAVSNDEIDILVRYLTETYGVQ